MDGRVFLLKVLTTVVLKVLDCVLVGGIYKGGGGLSAPIPRRGCNTTRGRTTMCSRSRGRSNALSKDGTNSDEGRLRGVGGGVPAGTRSFSSEFNRAMILSTNTSGNPTALMDQRPKRLTAVCLRGSVAIVKGLRATTSTIVGVPAIDEVRTGVQGERKTCCLTSLGSEGKASMGKRLLGAKRSCLLRSRSRISFTRTHCVFLGWRDRGSNFMSCWCEAMNYPPSRGLLGW